jgi:C-terminal processing protease CtpA/Prc
MQHVVRFRQLVALLACAALVAAAGCSGASDNSPVPTASPQSDMQALAEKVDDLGADVRALQAEVDKVKKRCNDIDHRLGQVNEDMQNRVTEAVQQAMGRGRRHPRFVPPAQPAVRVVKRPYMGFDGQNIEEDLAEQLELKAKTGVLVTNVKEGSPAAVAGVQKNDVVQQIDDAEVRNFDELKRALADKKPEQNVKLVIMRGDKKVELTVKLGERAD